MDYERLRELIKDKFTEGSQYEESDEANFIEQLESEMQKVNCDISNWTIGV